MLKNTVARFSLLGFSLIMFSFGGQALASSCKGMEKAACESKDGCYWVDAYKRKDGVEVSGHCRGKPAEKKSGGDDKETKNNVTRTDTSNT